MCSFKGSSLLGRVLMNIRNQRAKVAVQGGRDAPKEALVECPSAAVGLVGRFGVGVKKVGEGLAWSTRPDRFSPPAGSSARLADDKQCWSCEIWVKTCQVSENRNAPGSGHRPAWRVGCSGSWLQDSGPRCLPQIRDGCASRATLDLGSYYEHTTASASGQAVASGFWPHALL
jgi:hypothetical protein